MNNADRWAVPTLKDELDRKALESYEWVIEQTSASQMSEPEAKVAMQAIFNVTCGLVSREITDAAALVEIDGNSKVVRRRMFVGGPKSFIVSWEVGASVVNVTGVSTTGITKAQAYPCADARMAASRFAVICASMTSVYGLTEVL